MANILPCRQTTWPHHSIRNINRLNQTKVKCIHRVRVSNNSTTLAQANIGIHQVAQAKEWKRNKPEHHIILIIPSLPLPDLLHIFFLATSTLNPSYLYNHARSSLTFCRFLSRVYLLTIHILLSFSCWYPSAFIAQLYISYHFILWDTGWKTQTTFPSAAYSTLYSKSTPYHTYF